MHLTPETCSAIIIIEEPATTRFSRLAAAIDIAYEHDGVNAISPAPPGALITPEVSVDKVISSNYAERSIVLARQFPYNRSNKLAKSDRTSSSTQIFSPFSSNPRFQGWSRFFLTAAIPILHTALSIGDLGVLWCNVCVHQQFYFPFFFSFLVEETWLQHLCRLVRKATQTNHVAKEEPRS